MKTESECGGEISKRRHEEMKIMAWRGISGKNIKPVSMKRKGGINLKAKIIENDQ
jgi:hypothetical protein